MFKKKDDFNLTFKEMVFGDGMLQFNMFRFAVLNKIVQNSNRTLRIIVMYYAKNSIAVINEFHFHP